MTDHRDVIAAFVDNEPVGAGELAEALTSADGREYLIDVLVLRGLVGETTRSEGSKGPRVQGSKGPGPLVHGATGLQSRGGARGRWLTVAAALVAASLTAGFFAGRGTLTTGGRVNPSPAPIVTPAGAGVGAAPAPTHVIRMEKGVDWNERSGGN